MNNINFPHRVVALRSELSEAFANRNIIEFNFEQVQEKLTEDSLNLFFIKIKTASLIVGSHVVNGIIHISAHSVAESPELNSIDIAITANGVHPLADCEIQSIVPRLENSLGISPVKMKASKEAIAVEFSLHLKKNKAVGQDEADLFSGKKILLAEDNDVNVIVFQSFLDDWGVKTTVAPNGAVALSEVRANRFDAVLMDIHMPVMNGVEAIDQIRKINHNIPIIVLSGINFQNEIDEALKRGANEFLKKPVSSWELYSSLAKYCS